MKSFFLVFTFFLMTTAQAAKPSWVAEAKIDLGNFSSPTELAQALMPVAHELIYDGERGFCVFSSKIDTMFVESNYLRLVISFSYRGSRSICKDGKAGLKDVWTRISEIPNLTIEPMVDENL